MNKKIIILGSTGSIGKSVLRSINIDKDFKINLLTTNKNAKKILIQAIRYNVKNVIIEDKKKFISYFKIFKKKKINLFLGHQNLNKILKKKVDFCVNSISGIHGLEPTLKVIPFSKNILIANKESIVCAWNLISRKLKLHNCNFIPIDSEHFSIWQLIKNKRREHISKIILTASGGPFLNKTKKNLMNIKPIDALKHPNWKMGKKISIDSSTMMNKIFEFIEARKIFNLKNHNLEIIIHPSSFVHAVVFFKNNLIKFLAHDPDMKIPISSALGINNQKSKLFLKKKIMQLNEINFIKPDVKNFPTLSLIKIIPDKESYFETILITINDTLVYKYLNGNINYISIQQNLLNLIKHSFFKKYYNLKPKNIYDIKKMIKITKKFIESNLKHYDK